MRSTSTLVVTARVNPSPATRRRTGEPRTVASKSPSFRLGRRRGRTCKTTVTCKAVDKRLSDRKEKIRPFVRGFQNSPLPVDGELLFRHNSLRFPALLPVCDAPSGPLFSFIGTLARLLGLGSVRSIVGESLLKDQLLNLNHFQQRCLKARPATPNSLYYSNRLYFID